MISRDVIPILNLLFFPVNCTSKQPLGITQNFKFHYRKLLLRPIITTTTDYECATDIAKTLDVLQAIRWMGTAWSKVENDTIIKCSAAAGISSTLSEAATVSSVTGKEDPFANLDVTVDEELDNRVKQVAPGSGISAYLESEKNLTWSQITNFQPVTVFLPTNSCWRPLVLFTMSWK